MRGLFRTKSVELLQKEADLGEQGLRRVLGPVNLTALGVGGIIGAGIFVLTGQAAAQYAGPAIVISFIISGLACAFAGLCYAEFASMIPIAGSAYTYSYATMGELVAWIIGWDLVLEYLFGASTVAVGWSGYIVSFFRDIGVVIPPQFTAAAGSKLIQLPDVGWTMISNDIITGLASKGIDPTSLPHLTAIANIPAMLIIFAITTLLVIGIKESASFNNVIVILKVCVILMFVIFGMSFIHTENWTPFIPNNTGEFGHFGWSGIMRGAGVIFFAYIGFDAVSTAAQEAKNPQRDMPIGILGSLAVCTVLYIIVALVLTGVVSYTHLLVPDPMAVAVNAGGAGLYWLRPFIKLGAIAGLSSVILVLLLGQPRVFFSMSRDGLLPPVFAKVHPRFKTPYIPQILTGLVSAIFAGILPISVLGELVSIGTLLAFVLVCIGIAVLRKTHPNLPRAFKTPLVPWVPIIGALAALSQMASLPVDTWLRLIIWLAIGLAIYFLYGKKHSKLAASGDVSGRGKVATPNV
jgi:APA family basic amino acid/polyamine antiporter